MALLKGILIYLIMANVKSSYADTIDGYTEEMFWDKFDMNLWTFTIYFNYGISNRLVEISASRNECVKAIRTASSKIIEYLPVKVNEIFPNLVAVRFYNCSVKGISYENFEKLSELQYLGLEKNQIEYISPDTFKDLTELVYLELIHNKLFYINDDAFKNLKSLQVLFLHENQISFVSKDAFNYLPELRNISLCDNNLRTLKDDHFRNNKKLEMVWLYNNKIELLSPTFLQNIPTLKLVNLNNNTCINLAFCDTIYSCDYKFSQMESKIKEKC